ncbi:MAG: FecR family protein, partial [Gemmatimonadaceae bacterium]
GTARDIGTKFGVRGYADDDVLAVVVSEGAVALTAATSPDTVRFPGAARAASSRPAVRDSVILTEADLGRLDADGRISVERNIDVDAYLGWTEGRLAFSNTPLREVIPRLNRWYDIDVRLGDSSLGNVPYTASLKDEPLPHVLRLLAASLNVRVERAGKVVTLHRRRPR